MKVAVFGPGERNAGGALGFPGVRVFEGGDIELAHKARCALAGSRSLTQHRAPWRGQTPAV
jgi:hypothetical protein